MFNAKFMEIAINEVAEMMAQKANTTPEAIKEMVNANRESKTAQYFLRHVQAAYVGVMMAAEKANAQ